MVAVISSGIGAAHKDQWLALRVSWICFTGIAILTLLLHAARVACLLRRYMYARDAVYYLINETGRTGIPTSDRFRDATDEIRNRAKAGKLKTIGLTEYGISYSRISPEDWETSKLDETDLLDRQGSLGRMKQSYQGVEYSGFSDVMVRRDELFATNR